MASIHKLSWERTSLSAKFWLVIKANIKHWVEMGRTNDKWGWTRSYFGLVSSYHSLLGTARAELMLFSQRGGVKAGLGLIWWMRWFPLAGWCWFRLWPLTQEAKNIAGGFEGMTADQCDIYQSVARRLHHYPEAKECLKSVLEVGSRQIGVSAHTMGLLFAGMADVYYYEKQYDPALSMVQIAVQMATRTVVEGGDKNQAARIFKQCAAVREQIKPEDWTAVSNWRRSAEALARETGAQDQLLKMGVV